MITKKIVLLLFLKIIKVKANQENLCVISSDFVPNLLSNLVFEYKFSELQSTKTVLAEMKSFLVQMVDLWKVATSDGNDYDLFMYKFLYITEEYSKKADAAIAKLDLLSAKGDDPRVKAVADAIENNDYYTAMSAYNTLGNEGLLFTIVEVIYNKNPNSYSASIKKLIDFTAVLLKKRKMKPTATICLAIFKEMIKSKNIFTHDMMNFAEFISLKYQELNREYYHLADYQKLKEQFIYIESSLPRQVQDIVFGHNFHPTEYFYIKNIRWKEHLFVGDFFYDNAKDRRIAYTWEVDVSLDKKKWKFQFDENRMGYFIISHDYDEYLYATDNSVLYNVSNRPIFTRKGTGSITKSVWLFEPVGDKYFFIRNKFYDEYIYVPEDRTFANTYAKRRVFSYTSKGNKAVPQENAGLWIIERA